MSSLILEFLCWLHIFVEQTLKPLNIKINHPLPLKRKKKRRRQTDRNNIKRNKERENKKYINKLSIYQSLSLTHTRTHILFPVLWFSIYMHALNQRISKLNSQIPRVAITHSLLVTIHPNKSSVTWRDVAERDVTCLRDEWASVSPTLCIMAFTNEKWNCMLNH